MARATTHASNELGTSCIHDPPVAQAKACLACVLTINLAGGLIRVPKEMWTEGVLAATAIASTHPIGIPPLTATNRGSCELLENMAVTTCKQG